MTRRAIAAAELFRPGGFTADLARGSHPHRSQVEERLPDCALSCRRDRAALARLGFESEIVDNL